MGRLCDNNIRQCSICVSIKLFLSFVIIIMCRYRQTYLFGFIRKGNYFSNQYGNGSKNGKFYTAFIRSDILYALDGKSRGLPGIRMEFVNYIRKLAYVLCKAH